MQNNNTRKTVTVEYNSSDWQVRDSDTEGCEVDYIFDSIEHVETHEERYQTEWELQKAFFMAPWSRACMIVDRLDRMAHREAGEKASPSAVERAYRKRNNIDNRAPLKDELLQYVRKLQYQEDLLALGVGTSEQFKKHLWNVVARADQLLRDRKARMGKGYTYTSVAALKNNALSLLENQGVSIGHYIWKYNDKGEIIDFSEGNGRQDRVGLEWADEIRSMFYNVD